MKIKSQLTLAAIIVAGMFAAGCSQQQAAGSQQTAQQATTTPAAGGGKAAAGACDPKADKNCHQHPEAPDCAMSKWHSHPYKDPKHHHVYGCVAGSKAKAPTIPHVKAKGNYKGPVKMEAGSVDAMKKYKK